MSDKSEYNICSEKKKRLTQYYYDTVEKQLDYLNDIFEQLITNSNITIDYEHLRLLIICHLNFLCLNRCKLESTGPLISAIHKLTDKNCLLLDGPDILFISFIIMESHPKEFVYNKSADNLPFPDLYI